MGKYEIRRSNYDGTILNDEVSELNNIANELAEANRLKRLEMKHYVGMRMNIHNSQGLNEFKDKELEDQA